MCVNKDLLMYSRTSLLGPHLGPVLGDLNREVVSSTLYTYGHFGSFMKVGTMKSDLIIEVILIGGSTIYYEVFIHAHNYGLSCECLIPYIFLF